MFEVRAQGRIDGVLRAELEVSWGKARALVEQGKVFVDGERVLDSAKPRRAGQSIEIRERAPRPGREVPADLIVYSDTHVVVVRKPAGISTVPFDAFTSRRPAGGSGEDERGTLDEIVRRALKTTALGVVHRLDKETSGLLVFTRTWLAKQSLSAQFRAHTVERRYLAIARGVVPKRTVTSHLVADRGDGLRGSIEHMRGRNRPATAQGQRAVTHVEPLETRELGGVPATLVSCRLETGRTHQIRVHLSEMGHPIVGERVYIRDYAGPKIQAPRVMLHAALLGFVHPKTERPVRWEEPPPADFTALWDAHG